MTKTVIVCDICGKQITVDERVCLKRKAGKRGGEMNVDFCKSCMGEVEAFCNHRHPANMFEQEVGADIADDALSDHEFRQKVRNSLVKYRKEMVEIREGGADGGR